MAQAPQYCIDLDVKILKSKGLHHIEPIQMSWEPTTLFSQAWELTIVTTYANS